MLWERKNLGQQSYKKVHISEQKLAPAQAYLVRYVRKLDGLGISPRKGLLWHQAQQIANHLVEDHKVIGTKWVDRFLKRNISFQVKSANSLECERKSASNPELLNQHFAKFQALLKKHNIKEKNMWNMDKKGFVL